MNVKIKQIRPWNIFHCTFENQHELCMTLIRLQEFYESPKFRGRFFTLDEYIDWYCTEQSDNKSFTYMIDWSGFNVPGEVITRFYHKFYHDFRDKEVSLFNAFEKRMWDGDDPYYVIGTTKDCSPSTVKHEIRHAVFYLNAEYCSAVKSVVNKYRLKGLYNALRKMGYHEKVLIDEVQAYVLTGLSEEMKETQEIKRLKKELKQIEKRHIRRQNGD